MDSLIVDTPVPFSIHKLWFDLHCEIRATHIERQAEPQSRDTWALEMDDDGNPNEPGDLMRCIPPKFRPIKDVAGDDEKIRLSRSMLNIGRAVDGLRSKLRDPRFDFLFRPGPYLPNHEGQVSKNLDILMASWLGELMPVTILDLSGVPPAIQ